MPALMPGPAPLGATVLASVSQPHHPQSAYMVHLLSPLPVLLLTGAALSLITILTLSFQKSQRSRQVSQSPPMTPQMEKVVQPDQDVDDDDEQPLSKTPFVWDRQAEDNAPYLDLWDAQPSADRIVEYSWANLESNLDPIPAQRRIPPHATPRVDGELQLMPSPTVEEWKEGGVGAERRDAAVGSAVMLPMRRTYTKMAQGVEVRGEVLMAAEGWRRHTRVYGGGVCLACLESEMRARATTQV